MFRTVIPRIMYGRQRPRIEMMDIDRSIIHQLPYLGYSLSGELS